MKIKLFDLILFALVLTNLVIILSFVNGKLTGNYLTIDEIVEKCSNQSIEDAAKCLNGITSEFYKYNLENEGKNLSFEQLKFEGGVCTSWSEYYETIGKALGYNTKNLIVKKSDSEYHQLNIWSNEEFYCIMDQEQSVCFEFSQD